MIITGGIYKGRKILSPSESITRPTLSQVRMGVFNTLYSMIGNFEHKNFLDVFGGSGIMGLEALSRGFENVLIFEKNPKAVQIIKKNYSSLGIEPNLTVGDSLKLIKKLGRKYDVVYIDPPYNSDFYEEIIAGVINNADIIIAEHSKPLTVAGLSPVKLKNFGGKMVSFYSVSAD